MIDSHYYFVCYFPQYLFDIYSDAGFYNTHYNILNLVYCADLPIFIFISLLFFYMIYNQNKKYSLIF